jgi:hypothetical protein
MAVNEREAVVAAWCARDRESAVLPADRQIVDASAALRTWIVDRALSAGPHDDLYDACAILGRFIAQRGGSPTLASLTINHAADALGVRGSTWIAPACAAVAEGFAATLVESALRSAMHAWEFPSCAVALDESTIAVAAGHPSDDPEVIAAWAARIAKAAALKGVRRAIVSGGDMARSAVVDALALVGIEVVLFE